MNNETKLNLKFLNENINNGKDFNHIYKKSYEKESQIVTGECILNYLLENQYTKPFIKENYMMKSDDNSYIQKLNINNYQTKLNEILNKNKNKPLTIENSIMKRILTILDEKNKKKNDPNFKYSKYNVKPKKINENKPSYLNTEENQTIKKSFYEKYLLPKIGFNKKQIINDDTKNSFDNNKDIFKNTSISKTIEMEENILRDKIYNNKINYYSPCLRKYIFPIFKNVNQRHSISVKKGKMLNQELNRFNDFKLKLKSNTSKKDEKNKNYEIKSIKIDDRKYHLINLFKDLGKIKSQREIEETLFKQQEKQYKALKSKNVLLKYKK